MGSVLIITDRSSFNKNKQSLNLQLFGNKGTNFNHLVRRNIVSFGSFLFILVDFLLHMLLYIPDFNLAAGDFLMSISD